MKFLNDTGRIIDDGPLVFWKIRANFHIFNVTINQLVKSKINRYVIDFVCSLCFNFNLIFISFRIGKKYIGCILASCIDVTIKFDEEIEKEINEQILPNLTIDEDIIFRVKSFVPSQRYIEGIIDESVFRILIHTS